MFHLRTQYAFLTRVLVSPLALRHGPLKSFCDTSTRMFACAVLHQGPKHMLYLIITYTYDWNHLWLPGCDFASWLKPGIPYPPFLSFSPHPGCLPNPKAIPARSRHLAMETAWECWKELGLTVKCWSQALETILCLSDCIECCND